MPCHETAVFRTEVDLWLVGFASRYGMELSVPAEAAGRGMQVAVLVDHWVAASGWGERSLDRLDHDMLRKACRNGRTPVISGSPMLQLAEPEKPSDQALERFGGPARVDRSSITVGFHRPASQPLDPPGGYGLRGWGRWRLLGEAGPVVAAWLPMLQR